MKNIIYVFGILFLFACSSNKQGTNQIVYIDNYKVFESFIMKKDYDKLIEKEVRTEKMELDGVAASLNAEKNTSKQLVYKKLFFEKKQILEVKFKELSTKYTELVYSRLNEYIKEFGKKNHYSIILGTSGQGNVMFVDEKVDVTKALIKYVNSAYND